MSFNGKEGEYYTPEQAGEFTRRYRNARINTIEGGFIGREKIEKILENPNCVGIRVYLGLDEDDSMNFVFVGADAEQNDILDCIVEKTHRCPPSCSELNVLNS